MSDASLATSVPAMPWRPKHNDQGSVSSHNMFNIIMSLREHHFLQTQLFVAQFTKIKFCVVCSLNTKQAWISDRNITSANRKLTMAKPTSAFFKAGPSFVPSPVTATTCLCSITVLSIIPGTIRHEYLNTLRAQNNTQNKLMTSQHFIQSRKTELPFTRVCLSVGEERASTRSLGQILSMRSCSI